MAKLSYAELKAYVNGVVTTAKLSNGTFSVTRDNIVALVDKIGKIMTVDTYFQTDKLARFEGEYLSYGKTIEEWQEDLIMPENYDSTGANALAPHDPTYRPNFYSYTVGRKVIATTVRNNNIERAVHNEEQLAEITAMQVKRLEDSMAVYRYGVKREMLAKLIGLVEACHSASVAVFASSTAYTVGTLLKDNATPTAFGIVVKAIGVSDYATWALAVADGAIIVYQNLAEIAKPVDTSTGEAFIEQVKADIEKAQDLSEGFSLNGNSLGATGSGDDAGLCLIVTQGIMPIIEVAVEAGAFHNDKVAVPAEVIVVKDFGSDSSGAYAVLMDKRAMRLHNTYRATRSNENGKGDFLNLFAHTEDTAWISRNCFVKVYKPS